MQNKENCQLEYKNKIMKYESIEPLSIFNHIDSLNPTFKSLQEIEVLQSACEKLIDREEAALSNSYFDEAIERHDYNLSVLRFG